MTEPAAPHRRLDSVALIARIIPFAATSYKRIIELAFVTQPFNDCIVNYQEETFAAMVKRSSADASKMRALVPHVCSRGYMELARAAALHRCTIAVSDASGWSPLHHAVFQKRVGIVRLIVDHPNAPLNHRNNMGWTPLRCAIYPQGEVALEIVKLLCSRREVDVNATCVDGWTPLHAAAQIKRADIMAFLIERGAAVDVKVPKTGYTPLVLAIVYRSAECVELLLRKGRASLSTRLVDTGRTPLLAAIAGTTAHSYGPPDPHNGILEIILRVMHERYGTADDFAKIREVLSQTKDDQGKTARDLLKRAGSAKVRELMLLPASNADETK